MSAGELDTISDADLLDKYYVTMNLSSLNLHDIRTFGDLSFRLVGKNVKIPDISQTPDENYDCFKHLLIEVLVKRYTLTL